MCVCVCICDICFTLECLSIGIIIDVRAAREKNGVYIPHERFTQDEAEKKVYLKNRMNAVQ